MRLAQVTPFIPCSSLPRQIAFYRDVLGFTVGAQAETYAFLKRDNAALRLVEVGSGVDLSHPERQNSIYIDVEGVNDLYDHLRPKLDGLPQGRVRAPFDQDYGQREFNVADEDCTLIFFGQALEAP